MQPFRTGSSWLHSSTASRNHACVLHRRHCGAFSADEPVAAGPTGLAAQQIEWQPDDTWTPIKRMTVALLIALGGSLVAMSLIVKRLEQR